MKTIHSSRLFLIAALFLVSFPIYARGHQETDNSLRAAIVQANITEDDFRSVSQFSSRIREQVLQAVKHDARLLVFPEYINVFLPVALFRDEFEQARTVEQLLSLIYSETGQYRTARELFIACSSWTRNQMDSLYGKLAREFNVYILAGTYFCHSPAEGDQKETLSNRSVLYAPDGSVIHEQDKVYLTAFEQEVLHLDPGSLKEIESFNIDNFEAGLTICRDSFFPVWDKLHTGLDLWIDIRAEGSRWYQGREDFCEMLPEHLEESGTEYGITAALTGSFLDLFWEGKSSVSALEEAQGEVILIAREPDTEALLIRTLQL